MKASVRFDISIWHYLPLFHCLGVDRWEGGLTFIFVFRFLFDFPVGFKIFIGLCVV
jgi:hypothetical protein